MPGVLTIERDEIPPGDYCVIAWADFCGLMQGDADLRPRSVHFMRFTVPSDPPKKETPPVGGEAL